MGSYEVPFLDFSGIHHPLREEFSRAFETFLDRQWYVLGAEVSRFELDYARYIGQDFAVGVGSGMAALHLALLAGGIGPGDQVIVPANTYVATWLSVVYTGAELVAVDPDPQTANLSAAGIRQALTDRTRAIIPVHLYGMPCPMQEIMDLARENNLLVIEDNAQAHGARLGDKRTGSFGHANAHSFYPTKILGALGEAGAVTTSDELIADRLYILRNYGQRERYQNEMIGYNYRLDELQAALLNVKLKYLDAWLEERRTLATGYDKGLGDLPGLILPPATDGGQHAYYLYVIHTPFRDQLQSWLKTKKIETIVHYPLPPHRQTAFSDYGWSAEAFPVANQLASQCLSLPLYIGLYREKQELVIHAIREFWQDHSG
ncbi:MAG: DegT/DnrJ/EryC1/StrS family aminotransferase [Saprospiraceae bacterium]|nr:DegT/DnrJ/EryC1/StrS family aminotransferase [Saprospiraceae bacterium]MCB9318070.1 DegT/DnrJ/EryC1/StrS family aminotransferase [Lewinellaceae bacterium]